MARARLNKLRLIGRPLPSLHIEVRPVGELV